MIKLRFSFLALICIFFAFGCSTDKTRYREGSNAGQRVNLTVEQERQLTKDALSEMKKDYPQVKSAQLQAYIERLGHRIVNANKLKNKPYTYNFTAIDSPQVNAFAMPAGEVFITAPIIAMAESEAEIAGVLGHEIGHVVARHTAERMYLAKQEQKKMIGFGAIGAAIGGTAGYFLGKKFCEDGDIACKAKLTVYGAGGGAAAGILVQKYGYMKNSQEDELESDRVGFRYAVNAGYDKKYVGDFYKKLQAIESESKKGQNAFMSSLTDAMSSHPPSKARVEQAAEMEGLVQNNNSIGSTAEFQRMKKLAQEIVANHKPEKK